jgi:hypothetical protein
MNTNFPEDLFKPLNIPLHHYRVKEGGKICKENSILFCGICRNVGDILDLNISRLHRTGTLFKNYKIFIYENDSSDDTLSVLQKNRSDSVVYLSEHREDKDYLKKIQSGEDMYHYNRCKVLSECRNKYLSYLENMEEDFDYICVLDLDLKGGWSYDGIKHAILTLENDKCNGAVTSYGVLADKYGKLNLEDAEVQKYVMYDSFAFRPKNWNKGLHILSTPTFNEIVLSRGDEPFEVQSNFGGMAIYKKAALLNKRYGAKEWSFGYVDPDHVVLHNQMIQDGWKIMLDPSMISSYSHHKYSIEINPKES